MLLKQFFGSRTRVKLMGLFLLHPQNEYFIREITRKLKEQINSVRRELNNLKKVGMLKTHSKNRKKYYYINHDFALLDEFKNIFVKVANPQDDIAKAVSELGEIDFLLFSGQFVGATAAAADMFVVGAIDKTKLKAYLEAELPSQKVKFTVMTRADFLYRLDCKDKFVLDMLSSKEKVISVNNLQKYIETRTKARV
ncbi:MAG: winged helix-turn-helix domain-containing protein [Candidatus Gracilibacteria bacterium]|nr:winged helix-turn-helix domain-containing protein [Candidatus Gracilibacteria bacterium]MDD5179186.1 winged helix-turn-helix domain-containing protein [Candidatus Gracilibacteria bacterium]